MPPLRGMAPSPAWRSGALSMAVALVCAALLAISAGAQVVSDPKPDFQLRDANPNSPRAGQSVSPRDYRLQISAYYFGAAG